MMKALKQICDVWHLIEEHDLMDLYVCDDRKNTTTVLIPLDSWNEIYTNAKNKKYLNSLVNNSAYAKRCEAAGKIL